MSADEPRVQVNFTLTEFQELAEWLNRERPAIAEQLVQTWRDIQESTVEVVHG